MEQQSDKNPVEIISIPTDPSPPFSSLETNPSPSTSEKDSASSLGRVTNVVIPPFQRASLYYNRVRQVPTFHCQLCKRSFATHLLFENHKKFHDEDPSQQSYPFGLPLLQSSTPINPGIRFVTRRFEEKQRGPSIQYELDHIRRMFIFDSHTSRQMNNTNDAVSNKYRFVCRLCPCDPTFDKETDFSIHNRRIHPIIVEGTEEMVVPMEKCGFCSVATDLIERIQIGVPRPPLLTQKENFWHHNNPFCTLHSKNPAFRQAKYPIPLENATNSVTNTMLESGDDAASELPPSPPDLPNASDNEAPETQHLVNGSRSDAEDENRNKDELVLVKVAQKRRNLFKGVEFFKCTSSADPSQEFWQCGICNFSLPNSKTNERTGRMTPLKKLKVHNNSSYKLRVTKVIKRLGSRKYGKNPVGRNTPSKCNVCGCPLSTSRRHILLLHKFSHMSNVERKAALARGEGGTIKRLLSSKLWNRRELEIESNKEVARESEGFSGEVEATPISCEGGRESNDAQEFGCPHCQRTFTRKACSANHIRSCRKMRKQLTAEEESVDPRKNANQIFSSFKEVIAKVIHRRQAD